MERSSPHNIAHPDTKALGLPVAFGQSILDRMAGREDVDAPEWLNQDPATWWAVDDGGGSGVRHAELAVFRMVEVAVLR